MKFIKSPKELAEKIFFQNISKKEFKRIIENGTAIDYEYLGKCQESAICQANNAINYWQEVKKEIEKL